MKPLRVGIAGLGAIGRAIARKLRQGAVPHVELAGIAVRDGVRAQVFLDEIGCDVPIGSIDELAKDADLVVECAPAMAFAEIAVPVLSAGKMFMALSAGQFLERPELIALAEAPCGQVILPTRALNRLDSGT